MLISLEETCWVRLIFNLLYCTKWLHRVCVCTGKDWNKKKPKLHTAQSEHWHVSSIATHSEFNQWQSPTTFAETKTLSCPKSIKTQTNTDMLRPSQNRGQIKTKTEQSVKVWTDRTPLTWTVDQTHHSGPCERRHSTPEVEGLGETEQ